MWVSFAFVMGLTVILIEFVLGSALLSDYKSDYAVFGSVILFLLFGTVLLLALIRGIDAQCGCFGALAPKSLKGALIEDGILLLFSLFSIGVPVRTSKRGRRIAGIVIFLGSLWTLLFVLMPPANAVLQTGSELSFLPASGKPEIQITQVYWYFEPDCQECQSQVEALSQLSSNNAQLSVQGITDATKGRITEFKYDFEPEFNLIQISAEQSERIFLPAGSLILTSNGRVTAILRPSFDQLDMLHLHIGQP